MERGAVISECGKYRYKLWRIWDVDLPSMVWIMLNPSTADAETDDPTIRKCIGFAKANGLGGIVVVNLFAWRSTDPKVLDNVADPVGPDNAAAIAWAANLSGACIVGGWGSAKVAQRRARTVRIQVNALGKTIKAVKLTDAGQPYHPLYVSYSAQLRELGSLVG